MYVSIFDPDPARRRAAFHARAWLDDIEVTRDCQIADTDTGRVLLLKRDANGRGYRDPATGVAAKEWKTGRVRVELAD